MGSGVLEKSAFLDQSHCMGDTAVISERTFTHFLMKRWVSAKSGLRPQTQRSQVGYQFAPICRDNHGDCYDHECSLRIVYVRGAWVTSQQLFHCRAHFNTGSDSKQSVPAAKEGMQMKMPKTSQTVQRSLLGHHSATDQA